MLILLAVMATADLHLLFLAATTVTVDLQLLSLGVGIVVPLLTHLVTTKLADGRLRMAVLTFLAIAGGVISDLIAKGGTFILEPTLYAVAIAWVVAFAAHYGYSVAGVVQPISQATPNFGIGPKQPDTPAPAPVAPIPVTTTTPTAPPTG